LEAEHDNFRAALAVAQDDRESDTSQQGSALGLAAALFWFWHLHGHFGEGRARLERVLEQAAALQPDAATPIARILTRVVARAYKGLGQLAYYQGDYDAAQSSFEASAARWRTLGDARGLADALVYLAPTFWERGDHAQGRMVLGECVALARAAGDPWVLAMALWVHGEYTLFHGSPEDQADTARQGDPAAARPILEESAALFRQVGDSWGLGAPLLYLGQAALRQGEHVRARALLSEMLGHMRAIGDRMRLGYGLVMLADTALGQGDISGAAPECHEGLVLLAQIRSNWAACYGLRVCARLAAAQGRAERAARLMGAEEELRTGMGLPLPPHDGQAYSRDVAALRLAVGEEAFAACVCPGPSPEPGTGRSRTRLEPIQRPARYGGAGVADPTLC
jgi:tetratricopeptide (TPR) repeat protein